MQPFCTDAMHDAVGEQICDTSEAAIPGVPIAMPSVTEMTPEIEPSAPDASNSLRTASACLINGKLHVATSLPAEMTPTRGRSDCGTAGTATLPEVFTQTSFLATPGCLGFSVETYGLGASRGDGAMDGDRGRRHLRESLKLS